MSILDQETERRLAAWLFNHTWTLLDRKDRTPDDDDAMVHAAHASCHHWAAVGSAQERSVGEWQVARVYAVLGRPEPALHHARQALRIAEAGGLPAFYVACAHEAMARAAQVAGDRSAFDRHWEKADLLGRELADEDERDVLYADLNELKGIAVSPDQAGDDGR